jgi:subtilisin family serine protease
MIGLELLRYPVSIFLSVLLIGAVLPGSGHAQPRVPTDNVPGVRIDESGSCEAYDENEKFRQGDQCNNAGVDYSINTNDLGGSITSNYAAIGDDGGNGYVDYNWSPPFNLSSVDVSIGLAVKNNSSGNMEIELWNNSTNEWDVVQVQYNEDFNPYEYTVINIPVENEDYIDGGYFAVQLDTDDGWWISNIEADWTEAVPQIDVSPTALDYGTVTVGETQTQTVEVQNTGDATLTGSASIGGGDADQFEILNGASFTLDPGETYSYDVEYGPNEPGGHEADMVIDHNDPNQSSVVVSLEGSGEEQTANLQMRVENVSGGSTTVPRGDGVVELYDSQGDLVQEKETTPVDDGTGAGTVTFMDLDPSDTYTAQVFHDSDDSALDVTEYWGKEEDITPSGGTTENVTFVRYQPYLVGLQIFDDEGDNVKGEVVPPGTPLTVEVTVQNDGSAQSTESRLVLDRDQQPGDGGEYDFDQMSDSEVLPGGESETFPFDWTPGTEGEFYSTYAIEANVPSGGGPTGSGAWGGSPLVSVQSIPKLVVDPDGYDFGVVETTVQKDFTVENPGNVDLVFTPSIGGEDPGAFAVIGGGSEVAVPPGGSEVVTVEFQPQETDKAYTAELLLDHNGAENVNADPYPVALQGETPAPEITSLQWVDGSGTPITEAAEGDEVSLQIETSGYPEGTVLIADIYEDDTGDDDERAQRELEVEADGMAEARWTARHEDDGTGGGDPEFYFEVEGQSSNNLTVLPGADVKVVGSTLDIAGENDTSGTSALASRPLASAAEEGGAPLGSGSSSKKTTEADAHYFSGGKAIPLEVSTDRFVINTTRSVSVAEVLPEGTSTSSELGRVPRSWKQGQSRFAEVTGDRSAAEMQELVQALRAEPGVRSASPVYRSGGTTMIAPGRVVAWFDPGTSRRAIQDALDEAGLEIEEQQGWAENLFYLQPTGNQRPLEAANALHQHPDLRYAHLDFATYSSLLSERSSTGGVRNGRTDASGAARLASSPTNDEHFLEQWYLREMMVPAAWSTTRGSEDVTIAVIDDAVDVDHEDLSGNMVAESRWRDTFGEDGDPSPEIDTSAHGTAVAGVAAAVDDNDKGIAGACPNCTLLPVRTGISEGGNSIEMAEGIVWAVQNGADVLNLSLGSASGNPLDYVRHSILYARAQGRNGNGAVVVSSSGNDNKEPVSYPAKYAEVISVGATDKDGNRWTASSNASQYGENLDVMAPGTDLFTTDAVTVPGYDDDDKPFYSTTSDGKYVKNWNATSSASPSVAGIAGLVLSVNSELSATRVQSIIQNTATDISSNSASEGWDQYTGSGIANAYAAVRMASEGAYANKGQITVVNGGSVDAGATAQTSAGWLTLSPTSFSLPAEGQEVIEATVQHDQISGSQSGSVQVTVDQGEDPSSFSVSVDDQSNKPPNFTSPDQLIFEEGTETCHTVSASDPEGDDLEYYVSSLSSYIPDFVINLDLDPQSGELCMTPAGVWDSLDPQDMTLVATDGHSNGISTNEIAVGASDVFGLDVEMTMLMQGAYSGSGQMTTELNSGGHLPTSQPFDEGPWDYSGSESVSSIPSSDIVDWVLLELRETTDGDAVGRQAAFLKSDGSVVGLGGSGPASFSDVSDGDYYLVVYHRNHLPIMSTSKISFSSGSTASYDFTTGQDQAYGSAPMADLGDGNFGLVAGDVNADGQVVYSGPSNDLFPIFNAVGNELSGTASGYLDADVTMNGQAVYSGPDNDLFPIFNAVGNELSGTRSAQVPGY